MNIPKFIFTWKKTREKGPVLYIFKVVVLILIASVIGKVVGDYICSKIIFRPFRLQDYIGLLFLCFISSLIGLFLWNRNETRYEELNKSVNMYKEN